jgi:PilZ domain
MSFPVIPAGNTTMPQKLLEVLMLGRCSHEFSWPRRASDGDYYQVCLLCAAEYKYDWKTMRRTERVDRSKSESAAETSTARRSRSHARKPTWVPRARRLKLQTPVRYRVKNLGSWYEGTIDNLSQSGLLFQGKQRFPENTLVEMVFEMPEEISGQKNSTVLCQGRIIRAKESQKDLQKENGDAALAASILDYKFLRQNRS